MDNQLVEVVYRDSEDYEEEMTRSAEEFMNSVEDYARPTVQKLVIKSLAEPWFRLALQMAALETYKQQELSRG